MNKLVTAVKFFSDPAVGTLTRSVIRVIVMLAVIFGFNVSEEQLVGIMIAVEAVLQSLVQLPWGNLTVEDETPAS